MIISIIVNYGIFNDNLRHTHLYPKKTINPRLQLGLSYPIPLYKHSSIMIVPEINDPLVREVVYKSYRVMYYVDDSTVYVTQISHSAQDFQPDK